jgi:two-component system, chemotaxis family, protein-glutamate methylesterase/glutaminase
LFESAAAAFGPGAIGVILSGAGSDGTDGAQTIKAHGGTVIAQDETTSEQFEMPRSAIRAGAVDHILPIDDIAALLTRLVMQSALTAGES